MKNQLKQKLSRAERKEAKKARLAEMGEKQRKKYYLKRAFIVIIIIALILFAVYLAAKLVSDRVVSDEPFIEQIEEVYPTYTPFPAEWNVNLSQDADYLTLNTNIMYGEGSSGSLYSLDDFYTSYRHEGQQFFAEYFRILRKGDYEKYPSLFADSYKKADASKRFEKNIDRQFPPQRVHDITVRELGRFEDAGKNVIHGVYLVDYKINRNSNLFRNDIGWNSELEIETSRPLYFHLITENGKTYISNMYTETTVKAYAQGGTLSEE